ncbi:acyltransferase [Clostridium rectalis]|uniref:acyltransferase n=1 Tax=Clostridium rectalis TaxID=2040295 RepID=UPI000F63F8C0|nr:acyltransferase [Clostridium rectalis]
MLKDRIKELDILRAIAFILVVNQHIVGGYSFIKDLPYSEFMILKILYVIAKPAVPIFLTVSSIALVHVYYKKLDVSKYYIKRLKYIFIPYVIWSAINMYKLGNEDRFNNFISQVLCGNAGFHLWYMGMIIRLFLYFPIILWISKKIYNSNKIIRAMIFTSIFPIYYMINKYQNVISDNVGKFIFTNPSELQQKFINVSILFWILYFILGIYISLNFTFFKKTITKFKWVVILVYMCLLSYSFLNEIGQVKFVRSIYILFNIFTILFFYVISVYLSKKHICYNTFNFISKYSFAAYMGHIIIINKVVSFVMTTFNTTDKLFVGVLTWIITSFITPLFISIINCIPYFHYVTGTKHNILKDILKYRNSLIKVDKSL